MVKNVYCNAHARRKFKEALENYPSEAQFFIDLYKRIYHLEDELKEKPPDEILKTRAEFTADFEAMKEGPWPVLVASRRKVPSAKRCLTF